MDICLFDIDGTLLSSGGAGKAALESAFAEEFATPIRHHVAYSGRTDRSIMRELFRAHGLDDSDANVAKLLDGYLRRLPTTLKTHKGRVLPGIHELLAWMKASGRFHIGLLTGNVRAGAEKKLGFFDLFHHFDFGGFGDRHFERDDVAREALAVVRHRCGPDVPCERIWVIGDTPLDIQCARAIGARVIAVATGLHTVAELAPSKPDLLLADLSNLESVQAAWKVMA
jgi:phosphoglycolate phosphatase-like HAD superfamily hydrolase